MALELIKKATPLITAVGEMSGQIILENDLIVPDSKPDIEQILVLDGEAVLDDFEIVKNAILLQGYLKFNILYLGRNDSNPAAAMNMVSKFSHQLDFKNIRPGMMPKIRMDILHISSSLPNERKISTTAIVKVDVSAYDAAGAEMVDEILGDSNINMLKKSVELNAIDNSCKDNAKLNDNLEIPSGQPAALELLRTDATIRNKEFKAADDKMFIKCDVMLTTLYISDDENRSVHSVEHEIPFSKMIDVQAGNDMTSCDLMIGIANANFTLQEDSDGDARMIYADIDLAIACDTYAKKNIDVIEDAYGLDNDINLEKENLNINNVVDKKESTMSQKESIRFMDFDPEIAEMHNIICKPTITAAQVRDGKIEIEGNAEMNLLYASNEPDNKLKCTKQEFSFRHDVNVDNMDANACNVDMDNFYCNYNLVSSKEVEVKLAITFNAKVIKPVSIPLITSATESPLDPPATSPAILSLYFVQPGDRLWDIAKRYRVPLADLLLINGLEEGFEVYPGMQLLIPRRRREFR